MAEQQLCWHLMTTVVWDELEWCNSGEIQGSQAQLFSQLG